MRLGVIFEPCPNAYYRAVDPADAMAERGHEVLLAGASGDLPFAKLRECDVVYVYRRAGDDTYRKISQLVREAGVAVVYDNDDDLATVPPGSATYKRQGGLQGHRYFNMTVRMARIARVVTTTNERLAKRYRSNGLDCVRVVPNMLSKKLARPRNRHDGVVIGWVAGIEHKADLDQVGVVRALERIIAVHGNVRVESAGLDLRLGSRYVWHGLVPFLELPAHIGRYDIGLAPLADLPFNRTRSDIKVKEYAASGVPWLASPVGPYVGLGPNEGGILVPDDGWFEALDRLVVRKRERRRLARKASAWARRQTIDAAADVWERVFLEAASAHDDR